jgi:ankyrin repeat protein
VNAKASNGGTALMAAAQEGHHEVVRALLAAKADVNAKMDAGTTALMMAAQKDDKEVVQLLKSAGADER